LADGALVLAVAAGVVSPVAAAQVADPALVLREGAVARQQLVGVGRDVVVAGRALADVAALDGSVRVTGEVGGDVIVLGGDAELAATARVAGDVFALGGTVDAAPGAVIGGRVVSHPSFRSAWLTLIEGPTLGLSALDPLVVGGKLALVTAWLALTLLLLAVSGREMAATADSVLAEPLKNALAGLTAVLALLLAAVLFSALAGALIGVPLVALVVLFALALKLWGTVAVFLAAGRVLLARLPGRRRRPTALDAAIAGVLVLGVVKLLPWVGAWVWTAVTLLGVGATLASKFGRREPWFLPGAAAERVG
ncbi:MAG TPA: polymer-forming cytoskeletal protein, partial [Thermoanaerobaculia bacterium]|nr:polymer-forming cytoskeletal protein [Thermoanaerobaculia bacterium]